MAWWLLNSKYKNNDMKKLQYIVLFSMATFVGFAQQKVTLKIKENKVPCEAVAKMECLQVKEGSAKSYTYFYNDIKGFKYEPGFTYKLKVLKSEKQGVVPADASKYNYELIKIVSKKAAKVSKDQKQALDIFDKKLVLTQLNGKNYDNGSIYFTIDSKNNTIYGKSGVNRFNSTYSLKNDEINIVGGMTTMMGGSDEAMALEFEFNKALDRTHKVVQKGNVVQFIDKTSSKVIMELVNPTEKDIWNFIDAKEWKLFMLDNVGQDYGSASISFNVKENKVTGNNGCNNFFGTFSSDKDIIKFDQLASTRKGCLDPEIAKTEQKVMNYLNSGTLKFDVAEQTLNFYQDNKLVMMFGLSY